VQLNLSPATAAVPNIGDTVTNLGDTANSTLTTLGDTATKTVTNLGDTANSTVTNLGDTTNSTIANLGDTTTNLGGTTTTTTNNSSTTGSGSVDVSALANGGGGGGGVEIGGFSGTYAAADDWHARCALVFKDPKKFTKRVWNYCHRLVLKDRKPQAHPRSATVGAGPG
jgi:hypothetical protein